MGRIIARRAKGATVLGWRSRSRISRRLRPDPGECTFDDLLLWQCTFDDLLLWQSENATENGSLDDFGVPRAGVGNNLCHFPSLTACVRENAPCSSGSDLSAKPAVGSQSRAPIEDCVEDFAFADRPLPFAASPRRNERSD